MSELVFGEGEAIVGILNLACVYLLHLVDAGRSVSTAGIVIRVAGTLLGPEHPDTLQSMHSLGCAQLQAANPDRALPLLKQSLESRKSRLGYDHPDTLVSRNNLAATYRGARESERRRKRHDAPHTAPPDDRGGAIRQTDAIAT